MEKNKNTSLFNRVVYVRNILLIIFLLLLQTFFVARAISLLDLQRILTASTGCAYSSGKYGAGQYGNCFAKPKVKFALTSSSGSENVTTAPINVVLDQEYNAIVTVDYSVTGGSATSPDDFTLANGTLTFIPGDLTKPINIAVVDDLLVESNETIVVTISNPTNSTLGTTTSHIYTISDNDITPTPVPTSTNAPVGTVTTTPILTETPSPTIEPTVTVTPTSTPVSITFTTPNNSSFVQNSKSLIEGNSSVKNGNMKIVINETGKEYEVQTDANGKFNFEIPSDLKPGTYNLVASITNGSETEEKSIKFEIKDQQNYDWVWYLIAGIVLLLILFVGYRSRKNDQQTF